MFYNKCLCEWWCLCLPKTTILQLYNIGFFVFHVSAKCWWIKVLSNWLTETKDAPKRRHSLSQFSQNICVSCVNITLVKCSPVNIRCCKSYPECCSCSVSAGLGYQVTLTTGSRRVYVWHQTPGRRVTWGWPLIGQSILILASDWLRQDTLVTGHGWH